MTAVLLTLILQSLVLPPRTAMENPAAVSQVPPKIAKDYSAMWARFLAGKDDPKLEKDLDNLTKKQKTFDAAPVIEGYIRLYGRDDATAQQKFNQALAMNPRNRIALYYLAELAYAHQEYARASTLYAQLLQIDSSRPEIETKRQKTELLAADEVLRAGARAEAENRLADAEKAYRQALTLLPKEPSLHQRLADLLVRENKPAEAEDERKAADQLNPTAPVSTSSSVPDNANAGTVDTLDDLGRWGNDINRFHEIQNAQSIKREQLAALLVRYFPQLMEMRQTSQIMTDAAGSWAVPEIRTVVGLGLMDPLPNHTFEPSSPVTRGDLASTLARLMRVLGLSPALIQPVTAPDLEPTSALYPEAELVLGSGVMTLQDSGSFNVSGEVSGKEAVRSAERLARIFQQAPH
ncbi:MAG TPA: S-layer homology domain-containing protein [Terriglobia bacterium]|nr:S-layer homology domain-containing protein [Terriglobia bacterium]